MALKIYDETVLMCREMALVVRQIEKRDGDLARQLRRAASSVSLNCSEGAYSLKGHERARWHTAMGSAAEVRAILDVAMAFELISAVDPLARDRLDKIVATLFRLTR